VQNLSVQAASFESATRLFNALAQFQPQLTKDGEERHYVSVQLGSDEHVVAVLDAIQNHLADRTQDDPVSSMTVTLEERRYTVHDR